MRIRTRDELAASDDERWFMPALDRLTAAPNGDQSFLAPDLPVLIARAPGRLDVMGGIADYSGSLVLEMPLACATYAIAQRQVPRRLDILSVRGGRAFELGIDLEEILSGELSTPGALAARFANRPAERWAAYVIGAVYRCLTSSGVTHPPYGMRLSISSDVPEGKGVSSSAALEVAVMAVTAAPFDVRMDAVTLASACQWAENFIAGAPCGIMDQMTSALGKRDRLLRLLCQPATLGGHVGVPAGYRCYGIDSGIRHAVTGADYGTVRTAAFMGYRMVADAAGLPVTIEEQGRVRVTDDRWNGYLANVSPREFTERFADALPERMAGGEFIARYAGITDSVTRVDASRWYPVRAATMHPIFEMDRVTRFGVLLDGGLENEASALEMGGLMLGSHASYSSCGLGSDGTDRLVELALEAGPGRGVFGAKITGGGSGGTVAIFGTDSARQAIHDVARRYELETGRSAFVFEGSGPGADELGLLSLPPR